MSRSTSSLFETCVGQFCQLISSDRITAYENEVPIVLWQDELGRLRIWAKEVQLPSLEVRLRDAFHIREQLLRILHRLQRALTDMRDALNDTAEESMSDADTDEEDDVDGTEMQMIYHSLRDTINCLFKITMVILQPVHHPLVSGKVIGLSGYASSAETQSAKRKIVGNDSLASISLNPMIPEDEALLRRPHQRSSPVIDPVSFEEWGICMPQFPERWGDDGDTLSLYHGGIRHVLHFPSSSIGDGVLDIKQLKQHAMEAIQATSQDCIKLFHKGQLLEDDSLSCRDAGLKSQSTIYCEVLGAEETHDTCDSQGRRRQHEEPLQFGEGKAQTGSSNEGKSKDRTGNAGLDESALSSPSQAPSPPQAPDLGSFKTAAEQLLALDSHLQKVLVPLCDSFIREPPTNFGARVSNYVKLTTTIGEQVISKANSIETSEDDESQDLRRALLEEAYKMRRSLRKAIDD
ncbi:hypothetical protein Asppvi_003999 [Aspergillus pseudoviridinutans]|uniref:Ubiquitin-like domain-containing protein n=1 Tax=Aspergillus pseudoviridinutans TaxID=1517512 RepID=A0A9P3BB27_9EURO|nr:uncharacterized protein Asppvi_003999 [Aspergillus pseudoviridinutans]GIJ85143.1 hypothetical protein Asppvi_003999 [Aspergillus pseudoviridinutans]